MSSKYEPRCPHCYSADFQPVARVISYNPDGYAFVWTIAGGKLTPEPYSGEELHCNRCGFIFEEPVELRELEPVAT